MSEDRKLLKRSSAYNGGIDGYRILVLAVILRAVADMRAGDQEAKTWLLIEGPGWLDGCSVRFDLDTWVAWVEAGCPANSL